ncbi:hypothetical protein [Halorubrum vacuolatum]|uniref:Uncharacterized protein n=1 Tax=Halorubrum vacuolatum TaxID=63740 RepID=A0A238WRT6_HALVU|nr:hypothetical protein [Halorubrum vacuolatum]SNR49227.1 hypothetical protein SAMN06264855_109126 [Halorubrum vacuolatum]
MATAFGGLSEYTGKEIDLIDLAAVIGIPWFAATIFGVFSFELSIFGGYNFSDAIWSVGGAEISFALLAVLFLTVWILGTNELNGSDYRPEELAAIVFALLTPLMFVFVPAFESLVLWNDISQLFFTLAVSVATTWISYVA